VADAIAQHPEATALLLEKHGTIIRGATVREAYEATIELITRAEQAVAERKRGRRLFGGPRVPALEPAQRRAVALAVAPRLRGLLSRGRRQIVSFDDAALVVEFGASVDSPPSRRWARPHPTTRSTPSACPASWSGPAAPTPRHWRRRSSRVWLWRRRLPSWPVT
jgi:rhamnose utilization protein RhaD (predicted bifunctional aldolase and dehydrogenase)